MKKIIAKNPNKAQKISLVLFVSLMALSGILGSIFGSLLTWFVLFSVALVQIYYVTKWAQFYIAQQQLEKRSIFIEQAEAFYKKFGGVDVDKKE